MSQNKTVIQGLEPADELNQNMGGRPDFYSRGAHSSVRGTVVSGMEENLREGVKRTANPRQPVLSQQPKSVSSGKPVVGFLYSISRSAAGEYWPLHIGQNTIGQNPASDIVLPEGTVSSDHAILVVRKMKNPEKVIASISDARSTNGTMLNGESLGFSAVECKNGDIITVGDNYELYLILLDTSALGLSVSEKFIPVEVDEEIIPEDSQATRPGYSYPEGGYQSDPQTPPPFGGFNPSRGTVGLDGSGTGEKGGTIGM